LNILQRKENFCVAFVAKRKPRDHKRNGKTKKKRHNPIGHTV